MQGPAPSGSVEACPIVAPQAFADVCSDLLYLLTQEPCTPGTAFPLYTVAVGLLLPGRKHSALALQQSALF